MCRSRFSQIDALRIFAMLAIVLHHLVYNGIGWGSSASENFTMLQVMAGAGIESFVIIGVNLFFLISGYFGIRFHWKKIVRILFKLYLYSGLMIAFGYLTGRHYTSLITCLKDLILSLHRYWFIEVYVMLMLTVPILDLFRDRIEAQAKWFLLIALLVGCGYGFITNSSYVGMSKGYSLIFAITLYVTGMILRERKFWCGYFFSVAMICWLVNCVLIILMLCVLKKESYISWLLGYNNPLVYIQSICVFSVFANRCKQNTLEDGKKQQEAQNLQEQKREKLEKYIDFWSKNTLGVYILHSSNQVLTVYRNMPLSFLVGKGYIWGAYLIVIPYALFVFIVCTLIDKWFEKLIGCYMDKISEISEAKIERFMRRNKLIL